MHIDFVSYFKKNNEHVRVNGVTTDTALQEYTFKLKARDPHMQALCK